MLMDFNQEIKYLAKKMGLNLNKMCFTMAFVKERAKVPYHRVLWDLQFGNKSHKIVFMAAYYHVSEKYKEFFK